MALQLAQGSLQRLQQVWHHAPALEAALGAAEAAARNSYLPDDWRESEVCRGNLERARAQLGRLQAEDWDGREREEREADARATEAERREAAVQRAGGAAAGEMADSSDAAGGSTASGDEAAPASRRWRGEGGAREGDGARLSGGASVLQDPVLAALQLAPRAHRSAFAARLRHARARTTHGELEGSGAWPGLVLGAAAAWGAAEVPQARSVRVLSLCVSSAAEDLAVERRVVSLDVVPYLQVRCHPSPLWPLSQDSPPANSSDCCRTPTTI